MHAYVQIVYTNFYSTLFFWKFVFAFPQKVTAGANQAFSNLTVALVDAADKTVLFTPYYFNHLMALQMCGGGAGVVFGKVSFSFSYTFFLSSLAL